MKRKMAVRMSSCSLTAALVAADHLTEQKEEGTRIITVGSGRALFF